MIYTQIAVIIENILNFKYNTWALINGFFLLLMLLLPTYHASNTSYTGHEPSHGDESGVMIHLPLTSWWCALAGLCIGKYLLWGICRKNPWHFKKEHADQYWGGILYDYTQDQQKADKIQVVCHPAYLNMRSESGAVPRQLHHLPFLLERPRSRAEKNWKDW